MVGAWFVLSPILQQALFGLTDTPRGGFSSDAGVTFPNTGAAECVMAY